MMRSFRHRLLLMTALLVISVLLIAMALGWSRLLAFEVERLDERLCMEAKRLAIFSRTEPPRALESDLISKLRLHSGEQLLFHIESATGITTRESTRWHEIVPATMVWTEVPSPAARPRRDEAPRNTDTPAPEYCELGRFTAGNTQWHAARFTLPATRSSSIAVDLAATRGELQNAMRSALAWVIPITLALIALGSWMLTSLTMRPLNRLREAMKTVTQHALGQRLSSTHEDREFAELIAAYNTMLARLEASFQQASRFSADAAHELKTPLTILQGRIEQALNAGEHHGALDLTSMLDEVGRLSAITRKLLLLSQADAGRLALNPTPVDLSRMLNELIADAHMLLDTQQVSCAIAADLAMVGDALLLRQLFNNLISNAIRYCRAGGWIKVSGRRVPSGIEICFANTCAPISAADRQHFFDRFFRGDAAHGSTIEGSGLGLSLAREIARAHGGELVLQDSPAEVVALRLCLPVTAK